MPSKCITTWTYVASRWSSAWVNSSDAYMVSPPASRWTRAHCVMFSRFKYRQTVFMFWLKRVTKCIAILFSTECGIVNEGRCGRRRTYLGSMNPMVVRQEVWVEQDDNDVHDGCEKEPCSSSAFLGRREGSSSRLDIIFICDTLADATMKLSRLEKGWCWLQISGNSLPQNRSVGNAQYVPGYTGPAASIPSTTCRRAWIVNGQVERRPGEYW